MRSNEFPSAPPDSPPHEPPPHWPGARSDHVWRDAVCDRIAAPDAARLVLVRAPAGFGKTTAMQQARALIEQRQPEVETAWLTLERADNDVPRFLTRLAQALAWLAGDGATADPLALLAAHETPLVLFLDDFEQLQEAGVLGLVRQILDKLPRRARLVLGSRTLPDLGLARMRVLGQLTEVDTDSLRFGPADAADFLRRRGLPALAPATLALLLAKTEGWVAALWLASLALERHPEPEAFVARFSGSERAVADYLAEDVLARQPEDVREFLLRTSILRQLDLPLCQALMPRARQADCARILARLESDSIFLSALPTAPGEPPAWRYHALFADFLQAQAARQLPDELARLHLAAAGWYESQGRPVPAIDHALVGGDAPYALDLLARHAEPMLSAGRMQLLVRWFNALPRSGENLLAEHPTLQVVAVWASCFTQGPWEAMRHLEAMDWPRIHDPAVFAHAGALRPLLLSMMDRYDEAYVIGRESLARLPTQRPFADRALINTMASVAAVMGEDAEAERLLDAARQTSEGSRFERGFTEAMQALLDLQQGRLRQAGARYRLVLQGTHNARLGGGHSGNAWAGVLYAGAVYEQNQLAQARELLDLYLPPARQIGLPDHMIIGHLIRSRIAFAHGEIDRAFEGLTELEYLGHQRRLPRVAAAAKVERARLLMLQGHVQAARDELDRAEDTALWARVERLHLPAHQCEDLVVGRLRWDIGAATSPEAAAAVLSRLQAEIGHGERSGRQLRVFKLRWLLALAQQRAGDAAAAHRTLLALLADTCAEGYLRLYLDEGPAAAQLLHRCRLPEGTPPLLDDYLQRLQEAAGPAPVDPEGPLGMAGMPLPDLAEPLTRKEIRILELLAEGYSNNAMAEKLFVSDSTVRTHLRNINQKLGAKSRTQAVALARRLGVVG
ncbi:LuxR family transcriptional regulator, maltose regulon positive regulatory protein [Roseateles sp. YR242]|uniref:LuxR C-terminal-related transcriptional regulator n=1 Tax=Roseateles sp. YR242 TaxID=1855305 RepID=UPI0008D44A4B|nr:LuxR C-terminal-related transcriptional regulator [Roseateles sp. YR242]SEL22885.1 LuxR family transcriptional regulator, maltose regulon positive regulatory protein [Roseateles sp. YR242]